MRRKHITLFRQRLIVDYQEVHKVIRGTALRRIRMTRTTKKDLPLLCRH